MVVMYTCGGIFDRNKLIIDRHKCIDVENGEDRAVPSTSFLAQIVEVLEERDSKWILGLITYNIVIICYLCSWVTSTNSIALSAYANTIFFNVFALFVCLISIWVEQNSPANRNFSKGLGPISIFGHSRLPKTSGFPEYRKSFTSHLQISLGDFGHAKFGNGTATAAYRDGRNEKFDKNDLLEGTENETFDSRAISSLGLEKYEVLALLVSSCLSLMVGSLVSVEVVARLTDQPSIHTGRLGLGALLGFLAHLGTIIGYPDAGLNHVVCKALPCPTVRGCNPILGGNMISALILSGTHLVIHFWQIHITDTAAAFVVLGLTATSMLPLAFHTLNLMLKKLPRHMNEQLDKCLREALIIDGVLEFRNERFWTKSFGKLAGTLQVRVRQNANENHVLECVMRRLSKIVSSLTIQKFHESSANDFAIDQPVEYYVNEILPSRYEHSDDDSTLRECEKNSSGSDIDIDVGVVRIGDVIGTEAVIFETFSVETKTTTKFNASLGKNEAEAEQKNKNPMKTLTIYQNDNVRVEDRIWRGDLTDKNALLYGTKFDFHNSNLISVENYR